MSLANKITDILHGRVPCDDKLEAIAKAMEAEAPRADDAPFKRPVRAGIGHIDGQSLIMDANNKLVCGLMLFDDADFVEAAINAYEASK